VARNVPLKQISDVEGRVEITATNEFDNAGAGTSYRDNMRHLQAGHLLPVRIQGVRDGVKVWYGRANLELAEIGGTIDVRNDFGNTHLTAAGPFTQAAHRIITESGRIDVELSSAAKARRRKKMGVSLCEFRERNPQEEQRRSALLVGLDMVEHDPDGLQVERHSPQAALHQAPRAPRTSVAAVMVLFGFGRDCLGELDPKSLRTVSSSRMARAYRSSAAFRRRCHTRGKLADAASSFTTCKVTQQTPTRLTRSLRARPIESRVRDAGFVSDALTPARPKLPTTSSQSPTA
jgi:hypothetical protein